MSVCQCCTALQLVLLLGFTWLLEFHASHIFSHCLLPIPDLMFEDMKERGKRKKKSGIFSENQKKPSTTISAPREFRKIGSILDPDILPDTVRRVKLVKQSSDRPLGFYIRDGTSVRVTPYGLEKVPGIFISRLVPGGLAEGTGLLSVNDEIIEVNGIEVLGKTLDQVTDMMVANSQNLIITVKPSQQPPSTPRTSNTAPAKLRKGPSPPPRGTRSYTENSSGKSDRSTPSRQPGYEQPNNGPTKDAAPRKKNSETVYNNYTDQQLSKRHSLQT